MKSRLHTRPFSLLVLNWTVDLHVLCTNGKYNMSADDAQGFLSMKTKET